MNRLKAVALISFSAIAIVSTGGCSVGSALSQPQYVDFSRFNLGESRMQVAEVIGAPKSSASEPLDNHLVDYHEFTSGTPGATRVRAVGYIAGDLFTLGLAEIVFWPIELTIARPRDFKGFFSYDEQGHVNGYRIVYGDGTLAKQEGITPN